MELTIKNYGGNNMDLFAMNQEKQKDKYAPLAWRMRPKQLDDIIGQEHIIGKQSPLRNAIENDYLHSFILYGPPGSGKTTIARIIANLSKAHFEYMKAVSSGVNDMRKIAADAEERLKFYQQQTILFVDEIHRFNKNQQDVLLPYVEDGTLILVGATTENPLFELNNALLSRVKLYILEPLDETDIEQIVTQAINNKENGLGDMDISIETTALEFIARAAKGDARTALNILDTVSNYYKKADTHLTINEEMLKKISGKLILKYDRTGDYHYDIISAYIKSIRGSDPDAALYWLAVMLEGGEDPKFIARRLVVHAAEDIGLADPNALILANAAASAVQFIGMPECRIPLAEATIYLCTAPKSNSSITAIDKAIATVRQQSKITVPPHIADAHHSKSTDLLGKGKNYKYPHAFGGYVQQQYLPDELKDTHFYQAGNNGYEKTISLFIDKLKKHNN